jgi:uncharacterized protein with PIN domain
MVARLGHICCALQRMARRLVNFGDCVAYASAAVARDTLLSVSDDSRTDITP